MLTLAERHPEARLVPADTTQYYRWLVFMTNTVQTAFLRFFYPERYGTDGVSERAAAELQELFAVIERALEGREWLAADHRTAADLYLFMLTRWGRRLDPPAWEMPEPASPLRANPGPPGRPPDGRGAGPRAARVGRESLSRSVRSVRSEAGAGRWGQTPNGAFLGSDPAHGTVTEGARIARSARFGRVRVRTMRVRCGFYCLTKVRQIALAAAEIWPRLLWTEVITCHLTRPPVASALAAAHGIRRGLHAATACTRGCLRPALRVVLLLRPALLRRGRAPARRLAQGRSVRSVPSRQARMRAAPTQRPPIASAEAPHLLPHLWPMTPSTTGTWPIADPPGAARSCCASRPA